MAKKKQNIVITDQELTPTIIGKLDTKEKSPILLILIFIIFIAVAIFLPDITGYIENFMNGNKPNTPINNNVNKPNNKEEEHKEEEITYYDYTEDLVITTDLFNMSNIVIAENSIYFDIQNLATDKELVLDDTKYFLEIYDADKTLIQRIKISYGTIAVNGINSYEYAVDTSIASSTTKLLIVEKTEADYPEIELLTNQEGNGVLTCTRGHETITYTFANNLLVNINDIINRSFENTMDYATSLQNYQVLAATYNNFEGVSSTIVNLINGYTFTTLIDLREADINLMDNNNYYDYRTLAKTVKFETESNGFSCN